MRKRKGEKERESVGRGTNKRNRAGVFPFSELFQKGYIGEGTKAPKKNTNLRQNVSLDCVRPEGGNEPLFPHTH